MRGMRGSPPTAGTENRKAAGIRDRHDYSFSARAHHPKRFAACTDRRCQPARKTETPSDPRQARLSAQRWQAPSKAVRDTPGSSPHRPSSRREGKCAAKTVPECPAMSEDRGKNHPIPHETIREIRNGSIKNPTRLDLADGRKALVDYAATRSDDDHEDKRCDLPTELRKDLQKVGRNFFDAVCITHTDSDHCRGFGESFWLEHAAKYQAAHRIKIKELWVPAAAVLEEGLKGEARLVRSEARCRLREGKGVLVFSRPDALKKRCENEGLDFEKRKHLNVGFVR